MDLSPATIRTYRAQVDQIIRPRLGKVALTRLSPKHLDDFYGQMKDEGRSPKPASTDRLPDGTAIRAIGRVSGEPTPG